MTPEAAEEIDAARDALALVDAALSGDNPAAQLIVGNYTDTAGTLLRQLLAVTEVFARRIGELTDADPHQAVQTLRDGVADIEGEISE
ncbi:hypothetical protein [Mycolicibacter arupensis]|jgi:hypothetical protein|uniref:Uncharacterized protein n=1 Tax=Mycolicibacter arupensis TaxID=342002 RepID=A0A5C7Y5L7_9MYCO|nr:hypothetical protein [Mycolicibacter arupensis]TXI56987.1 MAG: hypothetical protein E6Q54_09065 [Mycolicibacter arupensis]